MPPTDPHGGVSVTRTVRLAPTGARRHLTAWSCECGTTSRRGYVDAANARDYALAHAQVCADDFAVKVVWSQE